MRSAAAALIALGLNATAIAAQEPARNSMRVDSAGGPIAAVPPRSDGATVGGSTSDDRVGASPLLPAGHWAVRAARMAADLGLVAAYLPAQAAVPRRLVERTLAEAAEAARGRDPRLAEVTAGWVARFREEFAGSIPVTGRAVVSGMRLEAGYEGWTGRVSPGAGLFQLRTTVKQRDDVSQALLRGAATVSLGSAFSLMAEPAVRSDGSAGLERWDARGAAGPLTLSVGRGDISWGPGEGGGVVLSDVRITRVEVATAEPVRPWKPLRFLGPIAFQTFATRLEGPRQRGRPYLWGMRAGLQPHPRLSIGLNRASIFGGDSIATRTNAGSIARMLIGKLSKDFENQVVSVDFRFRPPVGDALPLVAYLEWGAEDESGGWHRSPGLIGGLSIAALPFEPRVGVGLEHTRFLLADRKNPPWYLHSVVTGGWVYPDRPLGHPLGGEGWEWLGYGTLTARDARLRVNARGWLRERSAEGYETTIQRSGNLYAPERAGRSAGGSVDAAWRARPHAELRLSAFRDAGASWSENRLTATAALLF